MEQTMSEARLKAAYAAWSTSKGASIDAWLELMTDDAVLGSLGGGRPGVEFTGPPAGKAGARAYLEGLTAEWEMIYSHMDEFIFQNDRAAVSGEICWRNKATGKELTTRKADFWRFRDGQAIEFFEFYDTAAIVAAATR